MNYLSIKNWNELQHYKDRCPPWIKLHRDLLNDYEFSCLQDASKLHLMLIWLLASQMDNKIPTDPEFIRQRIGVDGDIDLKELIDKGFLIDDSNALAGRKQSAMLETEAETYSKEAETKKEGGLIVPDFIDGDVWIDFVKHRGGSKFTHLAARRIIGQLTKWNNSGHNPNDILNTSIMNGWKGVFEPDKLNGKGTANDELREFLDGRGNTAIS